ncbi:MAG: crosslink repair DNA glycosylase YcaQ family protein [Devosia sp.]|nr:crosslink repair DNA glycosylase YcaQ family protein [Devosia sp.]
MAAKSQALTAARARHIWLAAQRLTSAAPFGSGPAATQQAVEHLGYVQIDTINVIERCHHHILFSRVPDYARADLARAQFADKSVFECWTHALSYVPTSAYAYYIPAMRRRRAKLTSWLGPVGPKDYRALLRRIREEGALSIRDIDDEVLLEKDHPWASRKPSKRVLQYGFYSGDLTISARAGMVKTYELTERHFGWDRRPRPATEGQYAAYLLARALRSQGIVSLDSICYGDPTSKPAVRKLVEAGVRARRLLPVQLEGAEGAPYWIEPAALEGPDAEAPPLVHILSPFDPLIIRRQRLKLLFGYEHRFEAYVPADKRVLGYFALPVLVGDRVVAALDLKTDRKEGKVLVRKWTWLVPEEAPLRAAIEEGLHRFERFQLAPASAETA